MPHPLRHNQPQAHLNPPDSLQRYAADKLRIALAPQPVIELDDESKLEIDAAALVTTSVEAYAPQHREALRAILRAMLVERIRVTINF